MVTEPRLPGILNGGEYRKGRACGNFFFLGGDSETIQESKELFDKNSFRVICFSPSYLLYWLF